MVDSYYRLSDKLRIIKLPKHYFISSKHLNLLVIQNIRTQHLFVIVIFHVEIFSFSKSI